MNILLLIISILCYIVSIICIIYAIYFMVVKEFEYFMVLFTLTLMNLVTGSLNLFLYLY